MTIESYFFNAIQKGGVYDRVYNAQDITDYLDGIVGNGIFPNPSTNLQVVASSGMQVIVKAGKGWINGHKMINTSDLLVDVDISDVALNRIDRVVFFVDKTERIMGIRIKKGTGAISPVAPDLTRDNDVIEYGLATISVGKQITQITQAMITDTRLDDSVCGVIAGLIKQVGTETLFIQYQNAFETDRENNQKEFDDWFQHVKETLSTSTLIREYKNTAIATEENQTVFDIGIPQFLMETDILEVYVNGLRMTEDDFTYTQTQVTLVKGLDKSTEEIQNIVEFVVYKSVDGSDAETVVEQVEDLQVTKADKKTSTVTLLSSAWVEKKQTVNVDGVSSNSIIIVDGGTSGVIATEQGSGTLTFECGIVPTEDVTVKVLNLGVEL